MKHQILRLVNLLLALSFLLLILSSATRTLIAYSLYRKVHPFLGYVFAGLAFTHILLNFGWIKNSYFKGKKKDSGKTS